MEQINNKTISGFTDADIVTVLSRAFEETLENRKKALDVYDKITNKMNESDTNLAVLGSFGQNYLDVATKQTQELVKLASVMQKLKATKVMSDNPNAFSQSTIFERTIEQLDKYSNENEIKEIETKEVKRIDIKEFRERGYLQELNRRFLHPLGLALEVKVDDETGAEALGGVWDCRDEDEGIFYAIKDSDEERQKKNCTSPRYT